MLVVKKEFYLKDKFLPHIHKNSIIDDKIIKTHKNNNPINKKKELITHIFHIIIRNLKLPNLNAIIT